MTKIIKSLQNNFSLQYLNLSWNDIRVDEDLMPLAKFIRGNTQLVHLDMSKTL